MENLYGRRRNPAASLTYELVVEIVRRLPIRSVCQFKCVCRSWRRLIADHEHRKKLPQTLSGFFYRSVNVERCPESAHHFTNVTGKGVPLIYPSFSFLPRCDDVIVLDCCNGLLLCRCSQSDGARPFHYAVCNPATKEWVMLPDANHDENQAMLLNTKLAAISSHFHVLEYVEDENESVVGVEIYSSETGLWSLLESGWPDDTVIRNSVNGRSVFLNGFLHSVTPFDIAVVDMEGKKWRTIPLPDRDGDVFVIHQAQGHLCAFVDLADGSKLSVWILEDYDTDNWILKRTVRSLDLFGIEEYQLGYD
uniref:F-box domain-containing protein n=1 Tax=Oryza brachyantha TaxID=4533 RepID=J3MLM0_ORYBR